MKYLKLVTVPELPTDKHITFAYFGNKQVNQTKIIEIISKLSKFKLNEPKSDMFGDKNDIPCVVFKIDTDISDIRKELLISQGCESQNKMEYAPHISNVDLSEVEVEYTVIGIESNDSLFGIYL